MFNEYSDDTSPPGIGSEEATALWRDRLYRCLASQPTPVIVSATGVRSAASIWAGAREWTRAFRQVGVTRGQGVLCAHTDPIVVLQVTVACLWDGLDVQLAPDVGAAVSNHRLWAPDTPTVTVADRDHVDGTDRVWMVPAEGGWPASVPEPTRSIAARDDGGRRSDALLSFSDGTIRSHAELLRDADSLATAVKLTAGVVLVVGAWHTRIGVTGGMLAPLLHADELLLGDDSRDTFEMVRDAPLTHVADVADAPSAVVVPWMRTTEPHASRSIRVYRDDARRSG